MELNSECVCVCVQVVVQHLREQLKDLQGTKEALAVSKPREDALQEQVGAPQLQPH